MFAEGVEAEASTESDVLGTRDTAWRFPDFEARFPVVLSAEWPRVCGAVRSTRMTRSSLVCLAAIAVVGTALTSCGDDSKAPDDGSNAASADTSVTADPSDEVLGSEAPTPPGDPDSSPTDSAKRLLAAYGANDADTACGLQTERYTKDEITSAIAEGQLKSGADCRAMVALSSGYYQAFGLDTANAEYELLDTKGDTARVSVTYGGGFGTSTFVMVERDGDWLLDEEIEQQ